ncbi:hypothetical protein [Carnobacterium pleistocenium]|uniref:hypothetical protein n=1 Tax=Carnobacterium pleistocenium TaxID=181073 RepID=UPI00054CDB25|nr:hypothetical protein [Carnobacterium pleistocenium]
MDNDEKLSWKDRRDLIIEAGIGSIPTVGGALQTLYFGAKNEKRFKRVERFYEEISIEIGSMKEKLPVIHETENADEAISILESINDEVEKASSQSKIDNYKKAFKNVLFRFNNDSFDEEKYFIRLLPDLTELELNILFSSNKNEHKKVVDGDFYKKDKSNINIVTGNINRLSDFGLLDLVFGTLLSGGQGAYIDQSFAVSDLGSKFVSFIFE